MNKDKILKLLGSNNIQDNLIAFSYIADNYDFKEFIKNEVENLYQNLLQRGRVGKKRDEANIHEDKYVYVVNENLHIYTDYYWNFFELISPVSPGWDNCIFINHK